MSFACSKYLLLTLIAELASISAETLVFFLESAVNIFPCTPRIQKPFDVGAYEEHYFCSIFILINDHLKNNAILTKKIETYAGATESRKWSMHVLVL